MKLSDHFKIEGPLPFVDVEVDCDTRLFIDPHAVRLLEQRALRGPAAGAALHLDTFMATIVRGVMTRSGPDRDRAERILIEGNEPRETRLGMSARGYNGRGTARELGGEIWTVLNEDLQALVEVGLLGQLELLPLFVEGVAEDRVSDLTTRVIFNLLIDFTNEMVERYPQLRLNGDGLVQHTLRVWSPDLKDWCDRVCELPSAGGHPLVLVPADWVSPHLLLNARRYFNTTILDRVQFQKLIVLGNGAIKKLSKDALRRTERFSHARNARETLDAFDEQEDLLRLFTRFADLRFFDQLGSEDVA